MTPLCQESASPVVTPVALLFFFFFFFFSYFCFFLLRNADPPNSDKAINVMIVVALQKKKDHGIQLSSGSKEEQELTQVSSQCLYTRTCSPLVHMSNNTQDGQAMYTFSKSRSRQTMAYRCSRCNACCLFSCRDNSALIVLPLPTH